VDITPAFHSNPDDVCVQDFIKPNGNEDATLIRRLSSLSISFDPIPAFLSRSLTPEDQQSTIDRSHVQPVAGGMNSYYGSSRVDIDAEVSGSGESVPLQCTPPARANNALLVFQCSSGLHVPEAEGGHFLIPARNQLCFPPQGESKFVYQDWHQTSTYLHVLWDVRCDGFPSGEELRRVPHCTIIYSNPVSCITVCVHVRNSESERVSE
jgi:hypothetical protein